MRVFWLFVFNLFLSNYAISASASASTPAEKEKVYYKIHWDNFTDTIPKTSNKKTIEKLQIQVEKAPLKTKTPKDKVVAQITKPSQKNNLTSKNQEQKTTEKLQTQVKKAPLKTKTPEDKVVAQITNPSQKNNLTSKNQEQKITKKINDFLQETISANYAHQNLEQIFKQLLKDSDWNFQNESNIDMQDIVITAIFNDESREKVFRSIVNEVGVNIGFYPKLKLILIQ